MNNLSRTFIVSLAALLLLFTVVPPAHAQTILTQTTLSAKIADGSTRVITVASATGINQPTVPPGIQLSNVGSQLYVDRELMDVTAISGTTVTVRRGAGGTKGAPHASGTLVFVGQPQQFHSSPPGAAGGDPAGACTRTALPYPDIANVLPFINVTTGNISDCLGGQWVTGVRTAAPKFRINSPEPGAVLYTGINTNGTTVSSTTMFCSEVNLPHSKQLTGIALLNGTTVGTDKQYVALFDSSGNLLANSALAGVLTANGSTYQQRNFTTKYFAVGPAQYFACFQSDTGTDSVRMVVTGMNDNLLTKGTTGATFGTIPAFTVPTTFTTAVGPYVYLF